MSEERERRQQILEAATEEVAANGFLGTTIKSIAQRAELRSPALISWYFSATGDAARALSPIFRERRTTSPRVLPLRAVLPVVLRLPAMGNGEARLIAFGIRRPHIESPALAFSTGRASGRG